MWAAQFCLSRSNRHWISSGGAGTMGFGWPSAIGAQLGNPGKEVWAVVGDGGFQMTLCELATAQKRLAKLREIKQKMQQQANDVAAKLEQERQQTGGRPRNEAEKKRWQRAKQRSELSEQTMNSTDPDSRLMKDGATGAIVQGYNAQVLAAGQQQIIVAADVTTDCNDKAQLPPMVQKLKQNLDATPETLSADAGYWSEESFSLDALNGVTVLVPPDADSRKKAKRDQELAANAPRTERAEAMRARLKNPAEAALYAMRKAIVEPVFGQIKERRGFRRFSLRGLAQVRDEWALICLTHNLLKLHHHRVAQAVV